MYFCLLLYCPHAGGRQADTVPSGIEMLQPIIKALKDSGPGYDPEKFQVFMDGGIRRGSDVLKALACGARAVLAGRPFLWGLAVHGEEGVCRVIDILNEELKLAMQLCGVTSTATDEVAKKGVIFSPS